MVEGQFMGRQGDTAVLAGEPVAQENIEPGEGRFARCRTYSLSEMTLGRRSSNDGERTDCSYSEITLTRSVTTALTACQDNRDKGK